MGKLRLRCAVIVLRTQETREGGIELEFSWAVGV